MVWGSRCSLSGFFIRKDKETYLYFFEEEIYVPEARCHVQGHSLARFLPFTARRLGKLLDSASPPCLPPVAVCVDESYLNLFDYVVHVKYHN